MAERLERRDARLGMGVLFGERLEPAVVDGLCAEWVGLRLDRGGYVIADWSDVYRKEESEDGRAGR